MTVADSARWCGKCHSYGDHHTDRHPTTTLHFELPHMWVLNANQRHHWAVKARATTWLRNYAHVVTIPHTPLRPDPPMHRAHLTVRVGWPDKRRRDVANIQPTIKALVDGIIDAGLLPDDDDQHLIGPDLRPWVAGIKGHVVLDFEFEEVT